ncbi:MAG: S-methyl-5-thioribose-1-phosphate isomerase [Candidatus Thermoplasmatota archaeon]|nr:S-methyl-5-thioribose-1-phosphate isomerase [Candidatus Thermoplasmatota archaeon]
MMISGKEYRAVWLENGTIFAIDQAALPGKFKIIKIRKWQEMVRAIKNMTIRGAPAIGAAAAFGMAIAPELEFEQAYRVLWESRPTARDLFTALEYMRDAKMKGKNLAEVAQEYADKVVEICKKIGENGAPLIKDGMRILTHCNAGALATIDWGTALAPMRIAKQQGRKFTVFADETRPRLQGLLTSWELSNEGIYHFIIADNAAGHLMRRGEIDLVITGTDRVARNGDCANKIGTYEKAVLAHENGIPFYIAAPSTTIDLKLESGDLIPIEERSEEEVLNFAGKRIAPPGAKARNPAFDVTPAKYITGIITEKGIFRPCEIASSFNKL